MSQFSADTHPPLLPLVCGSVAIALLVALSVDDAEANGQHAVAHDNATAITTSVSHPYEPPALAPSAIVQNGVPGYRAEQGKTSIFFAASRAELRQSADEALQAVAKAWKQGVRLHLAGFHDETGNPQQNIALAKKRAAVVQKRLVELGVPASAIVMGQPAVAIDVNDLAEARRVEITQLQ